ncbi:MAG: hypothetical protein AAFP19_02640, partial [Bacteroidota bacterium]
EIATPLKSTYELNQQEAKQIFQTQVNELADELATLLRRGEKFNGNIKRRLLKKSKEAAFEKVLTKHLAPIKKQLIYTGTLTDRDAYLLLKYVFKKYLTRQKRSATASTNQAMKLADVLLEKSQKLVHWISDHPEAASIELLMKSDHSAWRSLQIDFIKKSNNRYPEAIYTDTLRILFDKMSEPDFRFFSSLMTYMIGIAANLDRNEHYRDSRLVEYQEYYPEEESEGENSTASNLRPLNSKGRQRPFQVLLAQLLYYRIMLLADQENHKERQRMDILLAYYENDLSWGEVAQVFDRERGTEKNKEERTRAKGNRYLHSLISRLSPIKDLLEQNNSYEQKPLDQKSATKLSIYQFSEEWMRNLLKHLNKWLDSRLILLDRNDLFQQKEKPSLIRCWVKPEVWKKYQKKYAWVAAFPLFELPKALHFYQQKEAAYSQAIQQLPDHGLLIVNQTSIEKSIDKME